MSSGPTSPERGELRVALGARRRAAVGVAHQALRDELGVDAGAFGERALDQQLADADAKAAADQLVEQEAPRRCRARPSTAATRARLLVGVEAAQRQQALLDPLGEADVAGPLGRRQHVRDRLGEVADRLVALVEQPVVDAGAAARDRRTARAVGTTWRGLPPARK